MVLCKLIVTINKWDEGQQQFIVDDQVNDHDLIAAGATETLDASKEYRFLSAAPYMIEFEIYSYWVDGAGKPTGTAKRIAKKTHFISVQPQGVLPLSNIRGEFN